VSPVKYELGFYILEDGILHSHHHENLKSYILILLKTMFGKSDYSSKPHNATIDTDSSYLQMWKNETLDNE
jgi:hypothetical protein